MIARATSDLHEKMLKRVGADRVVFPSRMQGERLGLELVRPNLIERLELDDHNSIEEIKVPELHGPVTARAEPAQELSGNVLAAGPAGELMVNPPASYVLMDGHVLVVMGLTEDLQNLPRV